jgi:hypothetical protein
MYFQIKATSTYSWVGLGIGAQMKGAYMFIMYADGNGNVTLSTRQGTGEVQPQYVQRSNVELLAGSGVSNGEMIANVRCNSCDGLDLTSSSTDWISAWKVGSPIDSTDPSANLAMHTHDTAFKVDLSQASITSDSNPFVGSASSSPSSSGDSGSAVSVDSGNTNMMLQNAHGIILTVVFVLGFPVGSMLMPLLGKWYVHASWNMIMFLGMWAGFGVGYVLAHREGVVSITLVSSRMRKNRADNSANSSSTRHTHAWERFSARSSRCSRSWAGCTTRTFASIRNVV